MIPHYRSKNPLHQKDYLVQAVQLKWSTWSEVCLFLGSDQVNTLNPARYTQVPIDTCGEVGPCWISLTLKTSWGDVEVKHGEYIIRTPDGNFFSCLPHVFTNSYDLVTGD